MFKKPDSGNERELTSAIMSCLDVTERLNCREGGEGRGGVGVGGGGTGTGDWIMEMSRQHGSRIVGLAGWIKFGNEHPLGVQGGSDPWSGTNQGPQTYMDI